MDPRDGPPWAFWPWGFDWWLGVILASLFLIAFLIGLAWLLLRWLAPSIQPRMAGIGGGPPAAASPLDLLRQRYAAGEIDAVTFDQMRERLEGSYRQENPDMPPFGPPPRDAFW